MVQIDVCKYIFRLLGKKHIVAMFYIIIGILIFLLSIYYDFHEERVRYKKFWINFLLTILIIIPALRFRVGGDTLSYMDEYDNMPSLSNFGIYKDYIESRYQPLWILFVATLKSISSSFVLFQIIHAIIINSIIFHILKKHGKFIFIAIFLYYIYAYFRLNFEVLREAIAICIFALSINSIINRKWVSFYFYAIIAFLFHDSAMILLPMPFLYDRRINFIWTILILSVSLIFFINANVFFEKIISLGILSDDFILRAFMYIESNNEFTTKGVFFYLLTHIIFPLFIYKIGKSNGVQTIIDKFFLFYIFVGLISSVIPGLYRFANYQIIFSILYFSNFINQICIRNKKNRLIKVNKLVFITIISIVITYRVFLIQFRDTSHNYPGTKYYNLYYPYYSIFNPIEYYPREQMVYNMWNDKV